MKHMMKIFAVTLAVALLPTLSLAEEAFGSAAVDGGTAYTLEEMLTYAIQDEYMAKAEYEAIQAAFGVNNPYTNIIKAEQTHQEELAKLFAEYGIAVPANTAAEKTVIPATLQETYATGVAAEIANIAMYETFLAQSGLPQEVRDTFTELMNASQSHLEAFARNAEKTGTGTGNGKADGTQTGLKDGSGRASGSAGSGIQNASPRTETADTTQTARSWQGRGGRNRN